MEPHLGEQLHAPIGHPSGKSTTVTIANPHIAAAPTSPAINRGTASTIAQRRKAIADTTRWPNTTEATANENR
jgi:hypothetical protein